MLVSLSVIEYVNSDFNLSGLDVHFDEAAYLLMDDPYKYQFEAFVKCAGDEFISEECLDFPLSEIRLIAECAKQNIKNIVSEFYSETYFNDIF